MRSAALAMLGLLATANAGAALDLRNAERHVLDNGLTVLLLEDRSFPLVSVQAIYRVGARNEVPGKTGLAHFVEHMAFRGSERFPDTGLVSEIYAVGGEWHGYTWIDQTAYFATVPSDQLELLLAIEADRMARLVIDAGDVEAEKGAVLAELQGYDDDPSAVLFDASLFASFVAHPYRNNTIGFAEDVARFTPGDVRAFYGRHYRPGNAVLAIVGDIDPADALAAVRAGFGRLPGRAATPGPQAIEPLQRGERRVRVLADAARRHFQLAWRAPAATHADFAAFLLLQEIVGGSGGVNFLNNEFGTAARADAPLAAAAGDIATWLIPTAQPYVFLVKGSIDTKASETALEDSVQATFARLAGGDIDAQVVAAARERLLDRLLLDLQTTEDAAHQLAYFAGIDALDALLDLPARVRLLSAADVGRVAKRYLRAEQRTVAWLTAGRHAALPAASGPAPDAARGAPRPLSLARAGEAELRTLASGRPLIVQRSPLSPTVHLAVTAPGHFGPPLAAAAPAPGVSTFAETAPAADFPRLARRAAAALAKARPLPPSVAPPGDPRARFEQVVSRYLASPPAAARALPSLFVVAGDIDADSVASELDAAFATLPPTAEPAARRAPAPLAGDLHEHVAAEFSQARVGYIVPAPAPGTAAADAWHALLYILSHGYEGRLGKAAISRRGLVYRIDARYRGDASGGLVTLSAGVDPDKLAAMRALVAAELERLRTEPPTESEVAEAIAHRLGRARSAYQANAELAAKLAQDWFLHGEPQSADALRRRLSSVSREDVLAAIDAFVAGAIVTITVGEGR